MRTSYAQHAMVPDRGGVEMALALAQCGRGVPEGVEVVATLEEALTATLENQAVRREAGIVSSFPAPVLPLDVPLLSVANTVKNIRAIYKAKVAHDTEFDLDGSKRVSGQASNPARGLCVWWASLLTAPPPYPPDRCRCVASSSCTRRVSGAPTWLTESSSRSSPQR